MADIEFDRKTRIAAYPHVSQNCSMTNEDTKMWNAVLERNRALDGRFVYAVKTTGIYCRPSCPSRRPNRGNVEFFDKPEMARKAGYRSCARCAPDASMNKSEAVVEKVKTFIEKHFGESLTLDKLAKAIGMSPFHLQRLFKAETGLTPRQYVDQLRISTVKRELSAGRQVTDALYEAGYGSSSRLYERSSKQLGMTPGAYRKKGAGEVINFAFVRSRMGLLMVAATAKGLVFVQFGESKEALKQALSEEFRAATLSEDRGELQTWSDAIKQYIDGTTSYIDVPINMQGTKFQENVWQHLRQIPPGETRTYTQVAEALGCPKAVRAVANACASNRIALAIPCHRVVRQDGGLGGYRWGLERKEALLKSENKEKRRCED
jgi:AraC family transcriptional regulator of adaptative response/methylated-DNA-[protein]-cysteine methyltransferase